MEIEDHPSDEYSVMGQSNGCTASDDEVGKQCYIGGVFDAFA